MPAFIITTFMWSNKLFSVSDYLTSAVFTIACLCSVTLWIAALSSKKLAIH
jgi:hypothetical protein